MNPAPSRRVEINWPVRALLVVTAFAAVGFLFTAQKIAEATLGHILTPDPSLTYQEAQDSLPIPRQLDWHLPSIQFMLWFRETPAPFRLGAAILTLTALGALFAWSVRRNREETASEPISSSPSAELLSDDSSAEPTPVVSDDLLPESRLAVAHSSAVRTAQRGRTAIAMAAYAAAIAGLLWKAIPPVSETLLRYYHTLGTFHQGYWLEITRAAMLFSVPLWIAVGLLIFALFLPAGQRRAALLLATLPIAALSLIGARGLQFSVVGAGRDWGPAALSYAQGYRPDFPITGVPDGIGAGEALAAKLKIKMGNQPEQSARSVLLFYPRTTLNCIQAGFTEDGLTGSLESATIVRKFLEQRRYESAYSWVATKHVFNVATMHFDTTAAIDACMTDMERAPHLMQCGDTTRSMLFICAASKANLMLLDRWADERRFAHRTRDSRRLMGALYERMGAREKAVRWYRMADMPESFIRKVQAETAMFRNGRISGRLLLNGKPLAGVQVGVAPSRLNGLPKNLEAAVLHSREELAAFRPQAPGFPPFCPRPYTFRWISAGAMTDASGRFAIEQLTEGEYTLVCTLPRTTRVRPPVDPSMKVTGSPGSMVLNYSMPTREIGDISIATR